MEETKKQPLLTPVLRWFLVAMAFSSISGILAFSLLPLYMKEMGASVANVGFAFTITSLVPLALQIIGGWVSDTIGRLRTMALATVAGNIGLGLLVWAPTWQWVAIALSIIFIATSLVGPSYGSFIADQSTEENRGKVYGVTSTISSIAQVIAPPLAGFLAFNYGFKTMLSVALGAYTICTVLRLWMAFSTKMNGHSKAEKLSFQSLKSNLGEMVGLVLAGGLVTWILIADGISDINFRLIGSLTPIYQETISGLTLEQIGLLGSVQAIVFMIFATPSGWISDKYGERLGILGGFVFSAVGIMIYLPATSFLQYAIAWVVFGIGGSMINPAFSSLVSKAIPEHIRGTAFGFFSTSLGLISLPAPWLGAQLWERFSPQTPFQVTAIGAVLIGIFCWFKLVLPKDEAADVKTVVEATP